MSGWKSPNQWARNLTPEQRAAVQRIRKENSPGKRKSAAGQGWTVFMEPTTKQPRYLELRHYLAGGGLARWVIEKDGSVSRDNRKGQSSDLLRVVA